MPGVEALEGRFVPSGGYVFSTIDNPNAGAQGSDAFGINASGQIVGAYTDASGSDHGYLQSGGQYTTLDDPNASTAPGLGTSAYAINASGQIVGGYLDASGLEHGFLLSGGQYTTLDDPAGTGGTEADGINASGQIVGSYTDASGVAHGFLLSGGQYTTLDDPNAGTAFLLGTEPLGINDRGQIVGEYADVSGVVHGFLLSGGQYTALDDPNAGTGFQQGTDAIGINNRGQIVGEYADANYVLHGFVLSGGQFTTLDDPNAVPGFYQGTEADGINASGHIVGSYQEGSVDHGFLATPVQSNSALATAGNPSSRSGVDSASGPVNVLVPDAVFLKATPLDNPALSPASTSSTNHGDGLGGLSTGQTTAVATSASPLRSTGDSPGSQGHLIAAGATGGKQLGVATGDVFAHTNDLFKPLPPL
jgi:probable HAF family extracellular repeat protein